MIDPVAPVRDSDPLEVVTERFQVDGPMRALSFAVIDDAGRPVGIVSRYQIMLLLLNPYSRDLFGRRPIRQFMNATPLVVPIDTPPAEAIALVTRELNTPIVEDVIFTDEGRYLGLGYVADILKLVERRLSERNQALARANREIRDSQAHLIQSEKMAALGQMVAGVAHEINTPLGYVGSNIQLAQEMTRQSRSLLRAYEQLVDGLLNQSLDESAVRDCLETIAMLKADFDTEADLAELDGLFEDTRFGLKQIGEIVVSLRNFARVDRSATDAVDLVENLESALTIAHHHLKNRIEVIRRFEPLPPVQCAPSQINQVLLNLLVNAAQAIEHDNGRILVRSYQRDGHACISVEDNGKGIAAEYLKRIFEPFFTTKKVGEGTGLGLSISYRIARDHGGDIRVASRPGVGTRFELALPLAAADAGPSVADNGSRPASRDNTESLNQELNA